MFVPAYVVSHKTEVEQKSRKNGEKKIKIEDELQGGGEKNK